MGNQCQLEYSGEQDSIFFLSNFTCAGDEIDWDFINMVKTSKISFTAFCNEMTRKYQTTNPLAASFISVNTFVKWIFTWMGSMQISENKWTLGVNMILKNLLVMEPTLEFL